MYKIFALLIGLPLLAACSDDASIASRNLSKAADMFEGRCSLDTGNPLRVTCKTGPSTFKKHYLGISDNVTWFAEQLESQVVSVYHYRVIFKPQLIIPDIDFRGDAEAIISN